jgi:uncharacterized membrane protein YdbT with pleckstrin-like domain
VIIGRSWWAIILAILALAVLMFVAGPPEEDLDGPVEIGALIGLIIGLGRIGWVVWDWKNTEFLVTNRRIVRAEGILNKRMAATSLEKVNDAVLTQSLFGRFFGFGDLDILSAAEEISGIGAPSRGPGGLQGRDDEPKGNPRAPRAGAPALPANRAP